MCKCNEVGVHMSEKAYSVGVASFPGPHACFTIASCGPGIFSHVCDV